MEKRKSIKIQRRKRDVLKGKAKLRRSRKRKIKD